MVAAANGWTNRRIGVVAVLLLGASTGAEAQGRASMGVSVTVAKAAARPTIANEAATFTRLGSGAVEMRSRLSVRDGGDYTLRIRSDAPANSPGAPVTVRNSRGFSTSLTEGVTALLSRSDRTSPARDSELVLTIDPSAGRTALTAELVSAPLDQ